MSVQRNAGGHCPPARPSLLSGCLAAILIAATLPAQAVAAGEAPSPRTEISVRSSGKLNRALKTFYRARGYRPLWISNGTLGPEADRLIELVATADLDGLDPEDYEPAALAKAVRKAREEAAPETLLKAEVALSRAFADYVRDVRRPPSVKMVYLDKELEPEPPSEATVLRVAALAPSLIDYLDRGGWASPIYVRLREALADHRTRWAGGPDIAIPAGPMLRAGSKGERVRLLRLRLRGRR